MLDYLQPLSPSDVPRQVMLASDALGDAEEVRCAGCNRVFADDDDVVYCGTDGYRCDPCSDVLVESLLKEAVQYARVNCKITGTIGKYDSAHEYRCTPEQYALGDRESYTPNAWMAWHRHNRTNYDELIASSDRDELRDRVYYTAIRHRIDELLSDQFVNEPEDEPEVDAEP